MVRTQKPWLLVGCPPCTWYSQMMRRNWHKMDEEEKRRRTLEANLHLLFCLELYREQMEGGRLFLHEHPDSAWSWEHPEMIDLAREEGVMRVLSHGCAFDMKSSALAA